MKTPGRWESRREGIDVYIVAVFDGDGINSACGEYTIAHLRDGFGLCGTPEETDANAALIVAAGNAES